MKHERNLPDPWWTNVTVETEIALYEGARDAETLAWALNRLAARQDEPEGDDA